jgi:hypothetical protein
VLLASPEKLGIDEQLGRSGDIQYVELGASDRKKGERKYARTLQPKLDGHHCYAVVAVPADGNDLFLFAANRHGDIVGQDKSNGKTPAIVGACIATSGDFNLAVVTSKPGKIAYQLFERSNFMQKQQEAELAEVRRSCLRTCDYNCETASSSCGGTLVDCRTECLRDTATD